jgi:hypothetical protein
MSYQVVNPATGEIAASLGEGHLVTGLDNFDIACNMADELQKERDERWDVIQIKLVYTAGQDGSKPRRSGTNS